MCKCTDKDICKIAKIYAEDLKTCFQSFETIEEYAYRMPDWLEVYQTGMRAYQKDIVVYDFDVNAHKGQSYFDFYRINENRLAMIIQMMINTFFGYSASQATAFITSLQNHGILWTS